MWDCHGLSGLVTARQDFVTFLVTQAGSVSAFELPALQLVEGPSRGQSIPSDHSSEWTIAASEDG
jgi:hypothetical protein